MAAAIKAVENGQTRRQQTRDMMFKILGHGAQTALTAAGGAIAADYDRKDAEDKKLRDSAEQYKAPDVQQATSTAHVPEWLKAAQGDPTEAPHIDPSEAVALAAQGAKARQAVNTSAAMANIGGYHTQEGADAQDQNASAMARDIGTAKQTMEMGGMMNSLARKQQDSGY
jgi:hypothetical protein